MDAEKILKELLEEYKNEFRENSTQQAFREGMVFGMRLAIVKLEEVEKETKTEQENN